ncbi:MAG: polysaccharide biosynthesis/export family protein [Bacteroidia bacterium]|nr:polysaccharide biosynthesis/export family protein [Bacteroidia bacterium]
MKCKLLVVLLVLVIQSCVSKKDILYIQDAEGNAATPINYQQIKIQPNDILKITVESMVPEAALPYNRNVTNTVALNSLQLLQLEGYLVSTDGFITFPVLGRLNVQGMTLNEVEADIIKRLVDGGHLVNPSVNARIINAKVTVLGEVNQPGTYNFTEQTVNLFQALGYAGDLTINGKRDDVIVTREVDGTRIVTHLDLTSSDVMNSEYYYVKPNDVIVVNPNAPRVKSAGFIGNAGTVLTIVSLLLSTTILLTR